MIISNIKQWVKKTCFKRSGDGAPSHGSDFKMRLNDLPLELVIEIATIAASSSQETYFNFSLVCKALREIVEVEALPHLPVRLESTANIVSFHHLLISRPELAPRVRHLWIRGARSKHKPRQGYSEPTASTWRQFKASAFEQLRIIYLCTKLVSLACSFPVMFLCFRFTRDVFFQHDQLKELTLFENWNLWTCFTLAPPIDGPHLFLQLTHLTIIDSVAPHFPVQLFPSLQSFSAEVVPAFPQAAINAFKKGDIFMNVPLPHPIRGLSRDVDISLLLVDKTERGVKKFYSEGDRQWMMRVGHARHFEWWLGRITGGPDIWTTQ